MNPLKFKERPRSVKAWLNRQGFDAWRGKDGHWRVAGQEDGVTMEKSELRAALIARMDRMLARIEDV